MTPGEFRAALAGLGLSQSGLAREMRRLGDPRSPETILRSVQRAAERGTSGEMDALLGALLRREAAPS